MKKWIIIVLSVLSLSLSVANSQPAKIPVNEELQKLFGRLLSSPEDTDRIRINDSIEAFIDVYVKSDSIFKHRFKNLIHLGQILSPDSRFKIVTWNLVLRNSASCYFCYFINRSGKYTSIHKMTGFYREDPLRTDTIYTERNWYGALYYDLRPVKNDNRIYWILLGIDFGNPLVTRKIIDVLSFSPDGNIILGKNWFSDGKTLQYREVFEYSSDAVISLKFLTAKSIVFDHLVPVSASKRNDSNGYYAPEYSFDSFYFDRGLWKFKADIDVRNKK